jgi:hypothetical protein
LPFGQEIRALYRPVIFLVDMFFSFQKIIPFLGFKIKVIPKKGVFFEHKLWINGKKTKPLWKTFLVTIMKLL